MMKKILELEHLKSFVLTGNDAERILQQIRPRSEEAEEGLKELKKDMINILKMKNNRNGIALPKAQSQKTEHKDATV